MTPLEFSRTMANAIPRIRSTLDAYLPDHMPVLTQKQMERSLRMTERMNARRKNNGGGDSGDSSNNDRRRKPKRPAAVLVPLCTIDNNPSILFTLRSATLSSHAGQISFPGGHVDCDDDHLIETALRETREELLGNTGTAEQVGDINATSTVDQRYSFDCHEGGGITILGQTGPVPAITGNMVTPIVGALTYDISQDSLHRLFPGNAGEVDKVFTMTVQELLEVETSEELKRLGTMGPLFPSPEGKIWGLTAIILRPILHNILVPSGFVSGNT